MIVFAALFLSLVWAMPAVAAEEHAASVTELVFPLINFLIFLYLIKRFGLPLVGDYLRSRREGIAASIREADEAKQRADALARDYKSRLARLAEETRGIRESLRAVGEREKAKLLAEAQEIAARIKSDADLLAEQEVRLARQGLRREIVDVARAAAEKIIQQNFSAADQKRMVAEFLTEVGAAR
ncbi:MAG TPA: ATP synthase F0 subunit B [Candidatus Binatia bacterium]|jgi:F-type H+-transporting ATPase subunit b